MAMMAMVAMMAMTAVVAMVAMMEMMAMMAFGPPSEKNILEHLVILEVRTEGLWRAVRVGARRGLLGVVRKGRLGTSVTGCGRGVENRSGPNGRRRSIWGSHGRRALRVFRGQLGLCATAKK